MENLLKAMQLIDKHSKVLPDYKSKKNSREKRTKLSLRASKEIHRLLWKGASEYHQRENCRGFNAFSLCGIYHGQWRLFDGQ